MSSPRPRLVRKLSWYPLLVLITLLFQGASAGVVQVNHGKNGPLKRMSAGDKILFYAGKQLYGQKELCQCFVALAILADDTIFQYEVSANFKPYRRKAEYMEVFDSIESHMHK